MNEVGIAFEVIIGIILLLLINQYVYDKYIQRKSSLLIN